MGDFRYVSLPKIITVFVVRPQSTVIVSGRKYQNNLNSADFSVYQRLLFTHPRPRSSRKNTGVAFVYIYFDSRFANVTVVFIDTDVKEYDKIC